MLLNLSFPNCFAVQNHYVHGIHFDLLPDMLGDIRFGCQVPVQPGAVVEFHDQDGTFHLPLLIQKAAGTDHFSVDFRHVLQVTRSDFQTLIEHVFAIIGSDYELHSCSSDFTVVCSFLQITDQSVLEVMVVRLSYKNDLRSAFNTFQL